MVQPLIPEGTDPHQTTVYCGACGYWLRGLPPEGRCPECGSRYDKFGGVWRSGKILVMAKSALLPRRCVKCNAPVEELVLKRRLSWHPRMLYVLAFLNVLIYVLVALIVLKTAVIRVGLCRRHQRRRWYWLGVSWFGVLGCIGLLLWGAGQTAGVHMLVALLLLPVFLVPLATVVPTVAAVRINEHFVWLKGVHPAYLAELRGFDLISDPEQMRAAMA